MIFRLLLTLCWLLAVSFVQVPSAQVATAQTAGDRYAVLIGGLGGDPAYSERFANYLSETRQLLIEGAGFDAGRVITLAEEQISGEPFVDAVSTSEEIRTRFEQLAERVGPDDHVYVVLFGHGSYDGERARLNIPRRDLDDVDYAALLDRLGAGRSIFINTASASGPFAEVLSAPDRIVITATASGTERNETVFPRFFVEALRSAAADLDRNGGLSVFEAFTYAAQNAARSFEESGHIATEHAQMDDNGDGVASRHEQLDTGGDGHLASLTYIRPRSDLRAVSDAARPLLQEKEDIERAIADLKGRKSSMDTDAYYDELEDLFVELARINQRMEALP